MHILCPHCHNPIEVVKLTPEEILCPGCGSSFRLETQSTAAWTPSNGERKVGKFVLLESVGMGAFGTVYKARDPDLNRIVAIKVPRAGNLPDKADADRFLREARSVANLRHASIVPIHEVGQADGVPYLVSEFVEGVTLADLLSARRPPPREAAQLIAAVADALHYAHQQGVVHRDVKPSNIMLESGVRSQGSGVSNTEYLTPDSCLLTPRLMDFGLAKRDAGEITMTVEGQVLGTPAYMSPEQARGEAHRVDGKSDVYSLGVILYQMLTGELPFRGTTRMLLHQVLNDEPRPPRRLNERIPRDLETICLKAMTKEPPRRYPSAGDLAADLRRFLAHEPIQARPVGNLERLWRWCRRNPALAGTGAVAATALLAATGIAIAFAITEAQNAERAGKDALRADADAETIRTKKIEIENALKETKRRTAELLFEQAHARCRQEDAPRGTVWLAHALQEVEKLEVPEVAKSIRLQLDGWRRDVHRLRSILGHEGSVQAVAFSPDGKTVLTGSIDDTARTWEVATGKPTGSAMKHQSEVWAVAFSPDGKTIMTGSQDHTARLWDAATGKPKGAPLQHQGPVATVAFSHDGKTVLTGSHDKTGRLWVTATGKPIGAPLEHQKEVTTAVFSPDGKKVLTGSKDNTARLWDAATGKPMVAPLQHEANVSAVAFSPDGKLVLTGSEDGMARPWEAATGKSIDLPHQDDVRVVAFSPDGATFLTGSSDVAHLWETTTRKPYGPPLLHHGEFVQAVAFRPDSQTVVTGAGNTARLWDTFTGRPIGSPLHHLLDVSGIALSPDGKTVLTGSHDATARLWEVTSAQRIEQSIPLKDQLLLQVNALSADGKMILTANRDKTARLWELGTGKPIGSPMRHPDAITAVAISLDGKTVLTGSIDKTVRLWEAATGKSIGVPLRHNEFAGFTAVALSPDGKTVLIAATHAQLWDVATGKVIGPPLQPKIPAGYRAAAFSPDGKAVLLGDDNGTAQMWKTATAEPIGSPLHHHFGVSVVAFSPDGKMVMTGSNDRTARLWQADTGKSIGPPLQHRSGVSCAAFSSDGKTLVTGSGDGSGRYWQIPTGKPIGSPLLDHGGILSVAFRADGKTVVTVNAGRTAGIWPVPAPLPGNPEGILLWAQVLTGMEVEQGAVRVLDAGAWEDRRRRLEELGGPPVP